MQKTVNFLQNKMKLASFFSGVGGIELGLENTSKFNNVCVNEFDKNAQLTCSENFDSEQKG